MDTEVKILLVEDDMLEAEKTIRILRNNNLADKLIHLRNGKQASDFIFGKGPFQNRNIQNQPQTIFFNMKEPQECDMEFLDRLKADSLTKNISLVVLIQKQKEYTRTEVIEQKMIGMTDDF